MENLSSLTILDLCTNFLNGPIPSELGHLKNIKQLDISMNDLTSTVLPSLYNISPVEIFALVVNHLHGEISSDAGFWLPSL